MSAPGARSWSSTTRRRTSSCSPTSCRRKGYARRGGVNGEEALAKLAAEPPDIVLLDIMMPGLSGYDVCRRIRADAATALLPVVLVTSLDPQQERVQGHRGRRRRLPRQADQPGGAVRARAFAAARQVAAGRSSRGRRTSSQRMERDSSRRASPSRSARSSAWAGSSGSSRRAVAEAIVAVRRALDPRAASPRDLLRVRRSARLHRVHRQRRAGGGEGGAARISRRDGARSSPSTRARSIASPATAS